jgi:hypothetical protein
VYKYNKIYVIENKEETKMINQLFSKNPDREIMLEILSAFGFQSFNNIDQPFNKKDLEKRKTLEKLQKLKPRLEEFYIPCKAKLYLNKKMTSRTIMTILRQFLKNEGYFINYWETYVDGVKTTYYQIKEDNKITKEKTYVVSFS